MDIGHAAKVALDEAIDNVCLLGYSTRQAVEKLLRPSGEFGFYLLCIIYNAVQRMHELLGTVCANSRERVRLYCEALAREARWRLCAAAAN